MLSNVYQHFQSSQKERILITDMLLMPILLLKTRRRLSTTFMYMMEGLADEMTGHDSAVSDTHSEDAVLHSD